MQDSMMPGQGSHSKLIAVLIITGSAVMIVSTYYIVTSRSAPPEPAAPPKVEAAVPRKTLVLSTPTRPPTRAQDTDRERGTDSGSAPSPAPAGLLKSTAKKNPSGTKKKARSAPMGTVDPKQVNAFMNARFSQVKSCYERRLKNNPLLEGKLDLNIDISPSGKVTAIAVNRDTVRDADMLGCVKRTIRGWHFPKPEGGRVVIAKAYHFKKKD